VFSFDDQNFAVLQPLGKRKAKTLKARMSFDIAVLVSSIRGEYLFCTGVLALHLLMR